MSKLYSLIKSILKDGKMTTDKLLEMLCSAMDKCSSEEHSAMYSELYEEAYGKSITRSLADEWVKSMDVPDGVDRSDGMKWNYDSCIEVGNKVNMDWNEVSKVDWYVVMNMMYSDYYDTAKLVDKQNDPTFFAYLSRDWILDEDAPSDKLYKYYFNVIACNK